MTLTGSQQTMVTGEGASDVTFEGVSFRVGGRWAANVTNSTGVVFDRCNVTEMGEGGIRLRGGDQQTLRPSGNVVSRSRFWRYSQFIYSYQQAAAQQGVGGRITQNEVWDAPHQAFGFGGNNHVVDRNYVHDVLRMTYDSGSIYADRNVIDRGNRVEGNLFLRLGNRSAPGSPCNEATSCKQHAVYMDDYYSGTSVTGNIFAQLQFGVNSHNGRNHTVRNNVFYDVHDPAHFAGGSDWGKENATFMAQIQSVPYTTPPWSTQYPDLATIFFNTTGHIQRSPALPRHTIMALALAVNLTDGYQPHLGVFDTTANIYKPQYCNGCIDGAPADAACLGCFTTWGNFLLNGSDASPFVYPDPVAALNFSLVPSAPVWSHGWVAIDEGAIGPSGSVSV